jgi:hypothetical protein
VAAAVGLAPVTDVGKALLGFGACRALQLVGEDAAARGGVDDVAFLQWAFQPAGDIGEAFPIQARGGGAGARQPLEHEVVELSVARELAAGVGPTAHFLGDPGGEPGG